MSTSIVGLSAVICQVEAALFAKIGEIDYYPIGKVLIVFGSSTALAGVPGRAPVR
jgi:hypothetical protein